MKNRKTTILFVFHEANLSGGATYSGLNLIESLNKDLYNIIVLVPGGGTTVTTLAKMGVKTISAPVDVMYRSKGWRPFLKTCMDSLHRFRLFVCDMFEACRTVKQGLSGQKIDIVHSNSSAILVGWVIAKCFHAKHVWHLREFIDRDFQERPYLGFGLMRRIIKNSDATISITRVIQKHWIGTSLKNAFQVYDAVKPASFISPILLKEKFFLFCSNCICDNKGAKMAMEAFCKSGLFRQGYRLKYIGSCEPDYKNILMNLALGVGANDSVDFLGYCQNVDEYFAKAMAFLMCSANEAMGRTTIEAFFDGCLVLGRNTGGTPELVHDKKTGYLFETVDELAELLTQTISKSNLNIMEYAQSFAMNNFTEECYGKKIMDIYDYILADNHAQQ